MSVRFFYCLSLFLFSFVMMSQTLTVEVNGIENNIGNIEIGLFDNEEGFTKYNKRFLGTTLKAKKSSVRYTFPNISSGTYAIAVFHDENKDNIINKNWLGVPKEKYGFSFNKRGKFGPPAFAEVSFKILEKEEKTMTITLN